MFTKIIKIYYIPIDSSHISLHDPSICIDFSHQDIWIYYVNDHVKNFYSFCSQGMAGRGPGPLGQPLHNALRHRLIAMETCFGVVFLREIRGKTIGKLGDNYGTWENYGSIGQMRFGEMFFWDIFQRYPDFWGVPSASSGMVPTGSVEGFNYPSWCGIFPTPNSCQGLGEFTGGQYIHIYTHVHLISIVHKLTDSYDS